MKSAYSILLAVGVFSVLLAGCVSANAGPTPTPPAVNTPRPSPTAPAATETSVDVPTEQNTVVVPETEMAPTETNQPTETVQPQSVDTFPNAAEFTWAPYLEGITRPTDLTAPNDGTGRIFILEQAGIVRVARDGEFLPEPFLDIRGRVGDQANEQGLLGLAFHPDYADNGYFFTNYTDTSGTTIISQWQVTGDPDVGDPDSEQILMRVQQPFGNHNGGGVKFGPDGYLYLALGDGGSGGDPQNHGQNPGTLLGTLLRIDPDLNGGYTIPEDNPFLNGEGQPEVWAYGLRNPWRFTFDDATGDLYIADVGQNAIEEINFAAAGTPGGQNYGWNYREGTQPFRGEVPAGLELVDPVFEYTHSEGCSITGGHVVRADHLPEWNGIYLYGDYCNGRVWGLLQSAGGWQSQLLFNTGVNISAFGKDEAGDIYLLDHRNGAVLRLEPQ
jgi:glucose/arabinose dehydrogenase